MIGFHLKNPLEGYRRLTFMMLDADIVAVSSTSVWRVLGQAGLLSKWNGKPSRKGTGFEHRWQFINTSTCHTSTSASGWERHCRWTMRSVWWGYVEHYNNVRLNSAIGYIAPKDMLAGRQQEIHAERDRKAVRGAKTAADSSPAGCVKNEKANLL